MSIALNDVTMPKSVTVPVSNTTQWPYGCSETFNQASPCNIMLDQTVVMVSVGNTIKQLLPDIRLGRSKLADHFNIIKPEMEFTFDNVKTYQNAVFVLSPQIKQTSTDEDVLIQG